MGVPEGEDSLHCAIFFVGVASWHKENATLRPLENCYARGAKAHGTRTSILRKKLATAVQAG